MSTGTGIHPDDPQGAAPGSEGQVRVLQVTVPAAARAHSTLARIDYDDAFVVETGQAQDRTAEQWARAVLEGAPASTRNSLSKGWATLGLRLDATQFDRSVLGWEVRRSTPDLALLGATGRRGLSGELLFERRPDTLLFATFVQLENRIARGIWAPIAPRHVQIVQKLLEQAFGLERHPSQP